MGPRRSPPGRSRQGPRLAGLTRAAATRPIRGIINKVQRRHTQKTKSPPAPSAPRSSSPSADPRITRRRSIGSVRNAAWRPAGLPSTSGIADRASCVVFRALAYPDRRCHGACAAVNCSNFWRASDATAEFLSSHSWAAGNLRPSLQGRAQHHFLPLRMERRLLQRFQSAEEYSERNARPCRIARSSATSYRRPGSPAPATVSTRPPGGISDG